jgi:hypothetical protein
MFDNFINGLCRGLAAVACAVPVAAAAATYDLFGATFGHGTSRSFSGILGDIDATFDAVGGNFSYKTLDGFTGVGVSGRTSGEIDIGESIGGRFSEAVYVPYLTLAFLFDGPEFGDVQETASISATLAGGGSVTYTLAAMFRADPLYSGPSLVDNLSPPTRNRAGVWEIEDPFDGMAITGLSFTAVPGLCGRGRCDNQSDFAFHAMGIERLGPTVTPVPEPGTMALLLSGMAVLGAVARRRIARHG